MDEEPIRKFEKALVEALACTKHGRSETSAGLREHFDTLNAPPQPSAHFSDRYEMDGMDVPRTETEVMPHIPIYHPFHPFHLFHLWFSFICGSLSSVV
ncbi:MAG: hypothetical protein D6755_13440 [Anaerolineae bacterium]|nr:MAG: hypothetical protein D6755_13440 [Anaerolineae bacterium]